MKTGSAPGMGGKSGKQGADPGNCGHTSITRGVRKSHTHFYAFFARFLRNLRTRLTLRHVSAVRQVRVYPRGEMWRRAPRQAQRRRLQERDIRGLGLTPTAATRRLRLPQPFHKPGRPRALGFDPGRAILSSEIIDVLVLGLLAAPELHEPFFGRVLVLDGQPPKFLQ